MTNRLRRSLAAKLIAGGCVLALIVVGGVAGYLIASRAAQTQTAALSNADNRAGVMAEVLARFTGAQSLSAATSLAEQPALAAALSGPDAAVAVPALVSAGAPVDVDGTVLAVTDRGGTLLVSRPSPAIGSSVALASAPPAVTVALDGGRCTLSAAASTPGGCGIEPLADGQPAYDVAVPVTSGGQVVGAVAYVAPLGYQLQRFQALFGFPTAYIPAGDVHHELRPGANGGNVTDPALVDQLRSRGARHAVYSAPVPGGGVATVAGSFTPVRASTGALTGYIGVEVPLAPFLGDERTDIVVVALIALFLLLLVAMVVTLFVERFVKRPIGRLERGVARIAAGDYTTAIAVGSDDELGRLAVNVNRMRDAIAGYVRDIEQARTQLDAAVRQVSGVSRALTATTAGVPALQDAVVRTATALGDDEDGAFLASRDGDGFLITASHGDIGDFDPALLTPVLDGTPVETSGAEGRRVLAVPMYIQDQVVGALGTVAAAGARSGAAVEMLTVLANNAAIAMENARLFEQERETVRRLRELDTMKTEFLGTVQHELRTPLTAIIGLADLLEMCWGVWEDGPKVEAVRDIQVAAANLHGIVETIIEYSSLEDDVVSLAVSEVAVSPVLAAAIEAVGERHRGGLPVPVEVDGDDGAVVLADPERFAQVLRAVLDNAVKFSEGRGTVRVRTESASRRRKVKITVTDEGRGIGPDDLPRIFDRFFQADSTATRTHGGTGMGLALVKRMVQAHAATIDVVSSLGAGTTVTILWPAPAPPAGGTPGRRRSTATEPAGPEAAALPVQ